jgi:cell wall-associated NlpC family hydrolase
LRPIRLLILLLAITLALVVALVRPLQGRATRTAKRAKAQPARLEPLRLRRLTVPARVGEGYPFGHRIVAYARHFLGVPYRYGGTTPHSGFDCSGLVRFVYSHFGIPLPHSSFDDLLRGRRVTRQRLRPGDLVFFAGASHVGIYAGRGRFIDAPHTGTVVRISTMQAYGTSYFGARRFHRG